jgi:hypothetical protein
MQRLPPDLATLLDSIVCEFPQLLGVNLVGIYLYGSLTQQAFTASRSDVDCIVVIRRDLGPTQFRRVGKWLEGAAHENQWVPRLQISFLIRDQLLTMNAKACLFHFNRLVRSRSDGNPIIWLNVLDSGVTLFGADPVSFVPTIDFATLFAALRRELHYLEESLDENHKLGKRVVPSYRDYAVLTCCRILYSNATGKVTSKPRAAAWAVKQLGQGWQATIEQALSSMAGTAAPAIPLSRLRRLIRIVGTRLKRDEHVRKQNSVQSQPAGPL